MRSIHGSSRARAEHTIQRALLVLIPLSLAVGCSDVPTPTEPSPSADARQLIATLDSGVINTPGGPYRRECVHVVPNGSHVERGGRVRRKDGTRSQLALCAGGRGLTNRATAQAPITDGWQQWAYYQPGGNFSGISATWTVPARPSSTYSGSMLYYTFPGLVSSEYIIQPVIQYGQNGAYGGNFWTATSWHCNSGSNCTHSAPIGLLPGDVVVGSVTSSGCSGGSCVWTITIRDTRTQQQSTYSITDTENYAYAVGGAVETYGLSGLSDFPVYGVSYSNIGLYNAVGAAVTPSWSTSMRGEVAALGFSTVTTATTVTLYDQPPPPPPPPTFSVSMSGSTVIHLYSGPGFYHVDSPTGGGYTYQWTVDGVAQAPQSGTNFTWGPPGTGYYTVAVKMTRIADGVSGYASLYVWVTQP